MSVSLHIQHLLLISIISNKTRLFSVLTRELLVVFLNTRWIVISGTIPVCKHIRAFLFNATNTNTIIVCVPWKLYWCRHLKVEWLKLYYNGRHLNNEHTIAYHVSTVNKLQTFNTVIKQTHILCLFLFFYKTQILTQNQLTTH